MKQLTLAERALWGILVLAICGVVFAYMFKSLYVDKKQTAAESVMPVRQVGDFSLVNQYGNAVTLKDLQGKIFIADFIFTNCAGECPVMTEKMKEFRKMFQFDDDVCFVSFSVDPENDSASVLKEYAENHSANATSFAVDSTKWLFLTGEKKEIERLCRNDFLLAFADSGGTPAEYIVHSSKFVLLNPTAGIVGYFDSNDDESMKQLYIAARKLITANSDDRISSHP